MTNEELKGKYELLHTVIGKYPYTDLDASIDIGLNIIVLAFYSEDSNEEVFYEYPFSYHYHTGYKGSYYEPPEPEEVELELELPPAIEAIALKLSPNFYIDLEQRIMEQIYEKIYEPF